jgi:hypothetical protein
MRVFHDLRLSSSTCMRPQNFDDGVVVGASDGSDRWREAGLADLLTEAPRGELDTTIAVDHQAARWIASAGRHPEGVRHEHRGLGRVDGPSAVRRIQMPRRYPPEIRRQVVYHSLFGSIGVAGASTTIRELISRASTHIDDE